MTRHAAFLRGVNLGRRTVRSAELIEAFRAAGCAHVETLLASGNVLFDAEPSPTLRATLEAALRDAFGFEVPIVLRTIDALRAVAQADPFGREAGEDAQLHVLLLDRALPAGTQVPACPGDYDVPTVGEREIFFVVYRKPDGTYLGRSRLSPDALVPPGWIGTLRSWSTVLKVLARAAAPRRG